MPKFREDINKRDFPKMVDVPIEIVEKLDKGTYKYIIDDIMKIRLYETDIVIFDNNTTILNSGGFRTNLTKNKMNDALSIGYIHQSKNNWYYSCNDIEKRFFDGMQIDDWTGKIINKDKSTKFNDFDKHNKKINKMIKAYYNKINKKNLPSDSSGDCLFCQLMKSSKDNDHLLMHLKEKYVMKSLILTALSEKGYQYPMTVYTAYKTDKNKSAITRAVTQYFRNKLLKK